jgi:long-chain acyl-CoA synthetase
MDAAGNLYFKGRKKDVIVTPAGMNVYPEDLEAALRLQPEVRDCVVVGLPKDGNAEACAAMILRAGTDPAEVVKRANESLAEYQQVRHWFVWGDEDFPRTSTQKPQRNEILRVVLAQGEAITGARSVLSDLIARTSRQSGARVSVSSELEADLNLSSLDRVELMGALEDRYQVDLSETKFAAVKTVGDLERMLHGQSPSRVKYHYPEWVQRWPHTGIRWMVHYALLRPAVFLLGWPKVEGRGHLLGVKGPLLVVCNHTSGVDVAYVLTALPAKFRNRLATAAGGEALEALRTPPLSRNLFLRIYDQVVWFLGVTLLNIFPLPRQAGFRDSFAYAGVSVDRGYSVLVFPEGRHTVDGKMFPFRAGIGLLANNLRIPILPMRIDGLFELKRAGRKVARPRKIQVWIGKPVYFPAETDPEEIARKLRGIVAGL